MTQEETKKCPHCAETIKAEATVCRYCGRDLATAPASPVQTEKPKKSSKRLMVFIVGASILVCCGIFGIANRSNDSSSSHQNSQVESVTSTPAPPAPSYEAIRSEMEGMTEAQFKNYARELKGKQATWTGWVEDVNEKTFGGYELWVDMDSPDEMFSVQDVTFDIPDDLALKLQKDQKITFSGTIDSVINIPR